MTAKWYIVNTLSGMEQKIAKMIRDQAEKKNLSAKIEDIVIPVENVTEIKKGKKVTVEKKIFSGYFLIRMVLDDETYSLVANTPKVTGFLGDSGRPSPIPERQVEQVLKQIAEGAVAKEVEISFKTGETVKIIAGPFDTFNGVIEDIDTVKKKFKVSVSIFGRTTPVELEFDQVEKIK